MAAADIANIRRTPVSFLNRRGLRLFGVLEEPPHAPAHRMAVILLSPGVKMRVGPQGLYRAMTSQLVALGFPVLRFDFFGLGDAEGNLTEDLLRDVYNHIEVGRFVDDALDAITWMQTRCGTEKVIVSGLCGGAITGLLAGSRDSRVAGLLALGITPLLASKSADPSLYMTAGELTEMRQGYMHKMFSPKAWLRLLTWQSDYRVIWRAMLQPLSARAKPAAAAATAPPPENDNVNPLFPPAFFQMLTTRRPMLLVFGGSDRLRFEFDEKFVARHQATLTTLPPLYETHVVEHANHTLSFGAWQAEMLDVATRWLQKSFPDVLRQSS